jgi:chromosome segregation ATPase
MNNYDEDVTIMTLNADIAELQHKLTSETARADKAEAEAERLDVKVAELEQGFRISETDWKQEKNRADNLELKLEAITTLTEKYKAERNELIEKFKKAVYYSRDENDITYLNDLMNLINRIEKGE